MRSLLLVAIAAAEPFCDGIVPTPEAGTLVLVQAELEQDKLGKTVPHTLGLYHTALVFQPAYGETWTIEFRASDFLHALFPTVNNATALSDLDWSKSGMGACITPGILHGREHWSVWKEIANLTAADVQALTAFAQPWTQKNPWSYQLFYVEDKSGKVMQEDLTCGQGVLATLDALASRGVKLQVPVTEIKITTTTLHVDEMVAVGEEETAEMLKFYKDVEMLGAQSSVGKALKLMSAFGETKYVRIETPASETYYRLKLRFPGLTVGYASRAIDWRGAFPPQTAAVVV